MQNFLVVVGKADMVEANVEAIHRNVLAAALLRFGQQCRNTPCPDQRRDKVAEMFAGAGQRFVDSDGSIEEDQKLKQRNLPGGQHPRTEQDHKAKPHAHHIIRDGNRQSRQQFIQHKTGNDMLYLFAESLLIIAHGLSGAQQLDVLQILLQARTDIQLFSPIFLVRSLGDFSRQRHHEKHHRHTYRQIQREPPVIDKQHNQCDDTR